MGYEAFLVSSDGDLEWLEKGDGYEENARLKGLAVLKKSGRESEANRLIVIPDSVETPLSDRARAAIKRYYEEREPWLAFYPSKAGDYRYVGMGTMREDALRQATAFLSRRECDMPDDAKDHLDRLLIVPRREAWRRRDLRLNMEANYNRS